jgi:hypothetical protein
MNFLQTSCECWFLLNFFQTPQDLPQTSYEYLLNILQTPHEITTNFSQTSMEFLTNFWGTFHKLVLNNDFLVNFQKDSF